MMFTMMTEADAPETKKPQLSHPSVDGQLEVIGGFTVEPDLLRDTDTFILSAGSSRFSAVKRHGKLVFKTMIAAAGVCVVGGSLIKFKSSFRNDAAAVLSTKASKGPTASKGPKASKGPTAKELKTKSTKTGKGKSSSADVPYPAGSTQLGYKGVAKPASYGCEGITDAVAKEACERNVLTQLTATLQGLLCPAPAPAAADPCTVVVEPLSGRRLQSAQIIPEYSYILFLTQLSGVPQDQINAAIASEMNDIQLSNPGIIESFDTIPFSSIPVPTIPAGYQFVGLGLCTDILGRGVWAACEYADVPDIATCASLCEASACFNAANGYTLAGLWVDTSACYCLKTEGGQTTCPTETLPSPVRGPFCSHEENGDRGAIVSSDSNQYGDKSCFRRL